MPRVRSVALFTLSILLAGAGCQQEARNRITVDGPAATAGLPLALDIENRSGAVVVQLDTTLAAPQVFARSMETGKQTWSAASYAEEGGRGVLRVLSAPNESDTAMVGPSTLIVRTPTAEGVRIRSAGGPVELHGVAPTSIEIESGAFGGAGGDVIVDTMGEVTGPVTITTTFGDVAYHVGPQSTGKFEATSGGAGSVNMNARGGSFASASSGRTKITGVLNKGENAVKLATQNGNVRISVYPVPDKSARR